MDLNLTTETQCDLLPDPYRYYCGHTEMSLSRVLTALWTRFLFWKHIADYATEQMNHYDDTWNRLEEFNDAVKQKAEPRLLTK